MVTYVADDGRVALVTYVDREQRRWTLSVYESWDAFLRSPPPVAERTFSGTPNSRDAETMVAGWQKVVRSDSDWSVLADSEESLPALPDVPPSVSARQIRLWLIRHGVTLAQVDAAIDTIPDQQQRDECRVEWDYAPYVERTHPMLVPLAAALGLSEAQVDDAFREAATI